MPVPCAVCNTSCPTACATICDAVCDRSPSPTPPVPPTPVPPPEPSPLTIMGEATVAWWRADVLVLNGGTVSSWTDQSGNGFDLIQAVGGNQPTFNATGGPNATPSVLFDGVNDDVANALLDLPAPATTRTFYWAVLRQVTWTGGDRLWGAGVGNNSSLAVLQHMPGGSPVIGMKNDGGAGAFGANPNSGLTLNVYKRLEVYFSDSVSDYIKAGGATQTGLNAGNTDPAATFVLGAAANLSSFANIEVLDFAIFDRQPTAQEFAELDAYATNRYGPGVVT